MKTKLYDKTIMDVDKNGISHDYKERINATLIRITVIIVAIITTTTTIAQDASKTNFEKYIKKFDIIEYIRDIDNYNPALFWDAVAKNNEQLTELKNKIQKGNKIANSAMHEVCMGAQSYTSYDDIFVMVPEMQYIADSLAANLGLSIKICIISDEEQNAFVTPNGCIFVTNSLVTKATYPQLLGICAHEVAHYILQHQILNVYAQKKKLRNNKITAAIASASIAAANIYASANGVAVNDDTGNFAEGMFQAAELNAQQFYYKYSREQEIEADIIAYRFLEWLGLEGNIYIKAIRAMGFDNDKYYDSEWDHPAMQYRANLLEYLKVSCSTDGIIPRTIEYLASSGKELFRYRAIREIYDINIHKYITDELFIKKYGDKIWDQLQNDYENMLDKK